jgi:hypothetical protein
VNAGRCFVSESVGHAYYVGRIHTLPDLIDSKPANRKRLVGRSGSPADRGTPEYESDYRSGHILVDAGKAFDLDFDARLLGDFAAYTVLEGFIEFEDATRRLPMLVIAAPHRKNAPVVTNDDPGDADGMLGRVSHGLPPWSRR